MGEDGTFDVIEVGGRRDKQHIIVSAGPQYQTHRFRFGRLCFGGLCKGSLLNKGSFYKGGLCFGLGQISSLVSFRAFFWNFSGISDLGKVFLDEGLGLGRQLLSCLFLQPLGKHTALAEDGRDAGRGECGQLAWAFLAEDVSERGGGHGIVSRAAALLHADAVGGVIDERTDAPYGGGLIARELDGELTADGALIEDLVGVGCPHAHPDVHACGVPVHPDPDVLPLSPNHSLPKVRLKFFPVCRLEHSSPFAHVLWLFCSLFSKRNPMI